MSTLKDLLATEEEIFRREELILRHFAVHVRGLRKEHIDPIASMHLNDCSDYFLTHGTVDGPNTPWIIGNRRTPNGKKEDC